MKVIIAGGRDFIPEAKHSAILDYHLETGDITEVVCGMQVGADMFGKDWADYNNVPVQPFPVPDEDWKAFGHGAGNLRNEAMAKYADAVILFSGGSGTCDMRKRAFDHDLMFIYDEDMDEI